MVTSFNCVTCSTLKKKKVGGESVLKKQSNTVPNVVTFPSDLEISPLAIPSCRAFLQIE